MYTSVNIMWVEPVRDKPLTMHSRSILGEGEMNLFTVSKRKTANTRPRNLSFAVGVK